ncbi:MAG: serine hydrolase [Thermomicrobiales bacterium]|nr:MAG: serine hydrolase [Thermomicrobiales bacterium]
MPSRTQVIAALPEPACPLTQDAFAEAMADYVDDLSGEIGVAVRDLETGDTFGYNATEIFPTASTLKVPLIYVLYRLADAGAIDLNERVTLSYANRVPGSGVLQHMDEGLQPTLRDLAELMIIVSDNWATDLLWNRLTKPVVDSTLAEIGLTQTSLPFTIHEIFATLAEANPADPDTTYDYLNTYLKDYDPKPDNPAMVYDARNDTSSPADMVRLLTLIDAGDGLSDVSRDAVLDTLKHQNFTTILQGRLPTREGIEVAHKTGSLRGVKNDVGLVSAPNARYAIALMSRGQDDIPEVTDRLSRISRWVYDSLALGAEAP